jgi:hypothetical protein
MRGHKGENSSHLILFSLYKSILSNTEGVTGHFRRLYLPNGMNDLRGKAMKTGIDRISRRTGKNLSGAHLGKLRAGLDIPAELSGRDPDLS